VNLHWLPPGTIAVEEGTEMEKVPDPFIAPVTMAFCCKFPPLQV